ncbi:MAG: hypothetical protein K1X71_20855 [Pirellulales bacterium]|nr:hypothetical protein [Pirellulales bacterium]
MAQIEGEVLIKRACGHSSPFTFRKNERYGRQRLETFLSKKCPACTVAAIAALEAAQKANSKKARKKQSAGPDPAAA